MKIWILHIVFYFLLSVSAFGQDYLFNVRYLTVEDGLLGRRINSIVQDDEGFIWIATNEGLNRFDGYDFQHITKDNFGLNSNRVKNIKKDKQGNIWVSYYADQYKTSPIQIINTATFKLFSLQEYLGSFYKEKYQSFTISKRFLM